MKSRSLSTLGIGEIGGGCVGNLEKVNDLVKP
jgi:hypothetical protein